MTKEDIEKAAVDSCVIENDIFNPQLTPYYEQGFKDGANWRINSVWHDARTEIPQENRFILVIHDDDNCTVRKLRGEISYCLLTWVRWAYIEDLIPNKED